MTEVSVELHAEAQEEYALAAEWYEQQRSRLGDEYAGAIEHAIETLRAGAAVFSPVPYVRAELGVKRVHVARFPYNLFVALRSEAAVLVLAVAHHRRRPGYWLPRLVK